MLPPVASPFSSRPMLLRNALLYALSKRSFRAACFSGTKTCRTISARRSGLTMSADTSVTA
ncbi:hypothetical protein SFUMM280S_09530 [Streptomyces fumanus]